VLKEAFLKGFFAVPAKRFIARHGVSSLGKRNLSGLLRSTRENSSIADSFFLWPVKSVFKRVVGEKKYTRIADKFNKGILDTDTLLGKPFDLAASKLSLTKDLFKTEEMIPVGKNTFKKITRSSITAPIEGFGKLVMPMAAASYAYSKTDKGKKEGLV